MIATKIIDLETEHDLEIYQQDDKIYLEVHKEGNYPAWMLLDKEDCKEIVKALNKFING